MNDDPQNKSKFLHIFQASSGFIRVNGRLITSQVILRHQNQ
jgi:hypothetical protein